MSRTCGPILDHACRNRWKFLSITAIPLGDALLQEVLALTKMNWNSAAFAIGMPVTVAFSRSVGQVLAELPENLPLRPEYRFYM